MVICIHSLFATFFTRIYSSSAVVSQLVDQLAVDYIMQTQIRFTSDRCFGTKQIALYLKYRTNYR